MVAADPKRTSRVPNTMLAVALSVSLLVVSLAEETAPVLRAPLERTVEPAGDGTPHWRAGARCMDEKLSLTLMLTPDFAKLMKLV